MGGHSGEVGFMRNQEEKMKILKTSNSVIGFVYLPNIGEEKKSSDPMIWCVGVFPSMCVVCFGWWVTFGPVLKGDWEETKPQSHS